MKKLTIYFGLAVFALSSCTKVIELELNDEDSQRLVVDGWITDEQKAHEVKLTLTTSYFETQQAPTANGAIVTISDGTNTFPLTEEEPGLYRTDPTVQGVPGNTYTLSIDYSGTVYTASTLMRSTAVLDSINYELHENPPGDFHYDLLLYTQETPGVGDHYMWRVFVNGESRSDTLADINFVDDEFVDGAYINGWNFDYVDANVGDTLLVEQHSLSGEAYDLFIAILLETEWRGGIFDSPPSNVPSNLDNGALGFFNATAVTTASRVILP